MPVLAISFVTSLTVAGLTEFEYILLHPPVLVVLVLCFQGTSIFSVSRWALLAFLKKPIDAIKVHPKPAFR